MIYDELFHVHTKRCKHAGNDSDEDYIKTALKLNAKSIYFLDHAPFPNDIFKNRMYFNELQEYISSMEELKKIYKGVIYVNYGLEIEYIPKYKDYYKFLAYELGINLFLGQHICEWKGKYNFEYKNKEEEYLWLTNSIIEAVDTKLFLGILHPERIYKNVKTLNTSHYENIKKLWIFFNKYNIPVEYNFSSDKFQREKFWKYKQTVKILYGLDAHNIKTLIDGTNYFRELE